MSRNSRRPCEASERVQPAERAGAPRKRLRSLDALHLATALSVRDDVGIFVTYDERLAEAADDLGLRVAQPI